MNNPNPFIPQGSILEQKTKAQTRLRLAVFFSLSLSVIVLMALLIQGCRKPQDETASNATPPPMEDTNPPAADTNMPPATNAMATPPAAPEVAAPAPATAPAPAAQDYTVVKGDTFSIIARKFGVTIKAIEDANPGVQPTKMQIGQKLHIPAPAAVASAAAPAAGMSAGGEQAYTVKSGDTIWGLSHKFGIKESALRAANNLQAGSVLKVGQKLKIPAAATAPAAPAAAPEATPAPPAAPTTSNPAPTAPPSGQ